MSIYELSRWMSLIEAVGIISDKCDNLDMNDKDHSWIKPIAIQKYVDERTEGILFELTNRFFFIPRLWVYTEFFFGRFWCNNKENKISLKF